MFVRYVQVCLNKKSTTIKTSALLAHPVHLVIKKGYMNVQFWYINIFLGLVRVWL